MQRAVSIGRPSFLARARRNWGLYLLMLPAAVIFICFTYLPMYGVIIAFKDFRPAAGIWGSNWAGLKYFERYFNSYMFTNTITNTLVISLYTIAVTFPLPILLALMCNQMYARRFKKFFQVSTYLPHFISTVVMCGMIIMFLSPSSGMIPKLLSLVGAETGDLMGNAGAFSSIYVWTEAWQHVGWDTVEKQGMTIGFDDVYEKAGDDLSKAVASKTRLVLTYFLGGPFLGGLMILGPDHWLSENAKDAIWMVIATLQLSDSENVMKRVSADMSEEEAATVIRDILRTWWHTVA